MLAFSKRVYLTFWFFSLLICAQAQENCTQALNEATLSYQNGNLYAIPGLLLPCINNGFTKEEKIQALRLLTTTYLYLNKEGEADKTFVKLLKMDPNHQVIEGVDPGSSLSVKKPVLYQSGILHRSHRRF